jgi:hypothetical protein
VAEKKPFLLRVDRELMDQLQRWANDDLRSVNGQIEFLLRDALKRAGRAARDAAPASQSPIPSPSSPAAAPTPTASSES